MLFNSFAFLLFLPIVFFVYWFVCRTRKWQNLFLLVCSYYFYGYWNWRFLILIAISSFLAYAMGLLDEKFRRNTGSFLTPKLPLFLSIVSNLGILMVFKYYNFFYASFVELFQWLNIALP